MESRWWRKSSNSPCAVTVSSFPDRNPRNPTAKHRLIRYVDDEWQAYAAGPAHPATQNAFRHGLAGIAQRRADGVLNPAEQSIREEILSGLLADTGGVAHISTAMRVLAEIIASDVSLLVTFNHASDLVIETNPKPERVTCPQGQVPCRILYALRKDYIKETCSTPLAPYLTTIPIPICRIILDSVAGVFSR